MRHARRNKSTDIRKANQARETFGRLYDVFRRRSGFEDRFEDHPGFDHRSGADNLSPWDRLVRVTDSRQIYLPAYLFVTLKKLMEDENTKELHPHFLLKAEYLDSYQKYYPELCESIRIRWRDQTLIFEAAVIQAMTMPLYHLKQNQQEAEMYVLLAEDKRFSDLFVFCKAVCSGCADLADEVMDKAKFEYFLFAPVYDSLITNEHILEFLQENKNEFMRS